MMLRDRICLWVGDRASVRLNENKVTYGMTEREVAAYEAGRASATSGDDSTLAVYRSRADRRLLRRGWLVRRTRLGRESVPFRQHLV